MIRVLNHKRAGIFSLFCVAVIAISITSQREAQSQTGADEADALVKQLVGSLAPEQKSKVIIDWDATPKVTAAGVPTFRAADGKSMPLRYFVRFTPGADRDGLRIADLNAEQIALIEKYIDATMSEYGARQARLIMDQEAHNKKSRKDYFITISGDPDKNYAFRLWEHHLTISTGSTGSSTEILPNLMGGHGGWEPNISWVDEERIAVELWNSLSDEQKKTIAAEATPNDQVPFPRDFKGMEIGKLDEQQRAMVRRLLIERLRCYGPWMRTKVRAIVQAHGGLSKLNIAFTGDPSAAAAEKGNRFAWKITGEKFLCDFSSFPTAPGVVGDEHIHSTLMGDVP